MWSRVPRRLSSCSSSASRAAARSASSIDPRWSSGAAAPAASPPPTRIDPRGRRPSRIGRCAGLRGHARRQRGYRCERARDHRARVAAGVGWSAGDDLVEHRAGEVHVRALRLARIAGATSISRSVCQRAREPRLVGQDRKPAARVRAQADRDAPVEQVDLAELADHHVVGLEVAVDDTLVVREPHRVQDRHQDGDVPRQQVGRAEPALDIGTRSISLLHSVPATRFITTSGVPSSASST